MKKFLPWLAAVLVVGCSDGLEPTESFPPIPAHMPAMVVPADNPLTPEKVQLGHRLFYEGRLSSNGKVSCSSCHRIESAFTDAPRQVSQGVRQQQGQRNAPTIINAGYRTALLWDGRASSLEDQARMAFTNPEEMDADTMAVARLMRSDEYKHLWKSAFGDTVVTMHRVMQAIATWERTLVLSNSRFDQFVRGQVTALTKQEQDGMRIFYSSKGNCSSCHGGHDFTDDKFRNVGLFSHYFDRGRYDITMNPKDEGLFKTPSLRNVALTPPYEAGGDSDQGLMMSLEQVIDHYNTGGVAFVNRDKKIRPLHLTASEQAALVAFLKTLTDTSYLRNPLFMAPR